MIFLLHKRLRVKPYETIMTLVHCPMNDMYDKLLVIPLKEPMPCIFNPGAKIFT